MRGGGEVEMGPDVVVGRSRVTDERFPFHTGFKRSNVTSSIKRHLINTTR